MRWFVLLVLLLPGFCWADAGLIGEASQTPASGASPDVSCNHESYTGPDCVDDGSCYNSDSGTPVCNDTTHNQLGTYGCYFAAASAGPTVELVVAPTGDTIWVGWYMYLDTADLSTTNRAYTRFFNTGNVLVTGTNDSSGQKWFARPYSDGSYYYSAASAASAYGAIWYRVELYVHPSAGTVTVWSSTNGTDFTQRIAETGLDTDNDSGNGRPSAIYFGYDWGASLPEYWTYDDIEVYYDDPGW